MILILLRFNLESHSTVDLTQDSSDDEIPQNAHDTSSESTVTVETDNYDADTDDFETQQDHWQPAPFVFRNFDANNSASNEENGNWNIEIN